MNPASVMTSANKTIGVGKAARGVRTLVLVSVVVGAVGGARSAQAQAPLPPAANAPGGLSPELMARAASPDPAARQSALLELVAIDTAQAQYLIMVMLQRDYDPRVRIAAAAALAGTRNPDYLDTLKFASQADADPGVRAAANAAYEALWPFGRRIKFATGLSVLCPGCGYFYLKRPNQAIAYLLPSGALLGTVFALAGNNPKVTINGQRRSLPDNDDPLILPIGSALQNLWCYGIFATYRDARLAQGEFGYKYPVARETLGELVVAPFHPKVLKSPWVWAGIPALLAAAYGFTRLVSPEDLGEGMRSLNDGGDVNFLGKRYSAGTGFLLGEAYWATTFVPVGIGEEALFRGVIQAGLSETSLGLWGGWAVASIIFGAVHIPNFLDGQTNFRTGALAVPYLMATGSYLGYVYIRTEFSLAASTAIHFWYDFLLSTIAFVAAPDDQPFVVNHAFTF